jgi:hypothetical protein
MTFRHFLSLHQQRRRDRNEERIALNARSRRQFHPRVVVTLEIGGRLFSLCRSVG